MKDIFGRDIYALPEDTTTRQRDGIYVDLAQPWERPVGWLDVLQDRPAHLCSRVCEEHGDLKELMK